MRVLITGSRSWTGPQATQRLIQVLSRVEDLAAVLGSPLTIVHGACPTGADAIAKFWIGQQMGDVGEDPHPADWKGPLGKAAGFHRNQTMVLSNIDMCLGFLRDSSPGTSDCLQKARDAGVPTFTVHWEEGWNDGQLSV